MATTLKYSWHLSKYIDRVDVRSKYRQDWMMLGSQILDKRQDKTTYDVIITMSSTIFPTIAHNKRIVRSEVYNVSKSQFVA